MSFKKALNIRNIRNCYLPVCPFCQEERGNRTNKFDTAVGYSCDLELPKMALPPKPPCHETE